MLRVNARASARDEVLRYRRTLILHVLLMSESLLIVSVGVMLAVGILLASIAAANLCL